LDPTELLDGSIALLGDFIELLGVFIGLLGDLIERRDAKFCVSTIKN
jgi:hypothetical protein